MSQNYGPKLKIREDQQDQKDLPEQFTLILQFSSKILKNAKALVFLVKSLSRKSLSAET